MVIMFMISASTALACIVAIVSALAVIVDSDHRLRTDKIDKRKHAVWRARDWLVHKAVEGTRIGWEKVAQRFRKVKTKSEYDVEMDTQERLLG